MSFTDKFIKVPVIRYNAQEGELLGKDPADCERYLGYRMIDPHEIYSYEPSIPRGQSLDSKNEIWTSIYFKNGDSFYTPIPIDQFENILNNFQPDIIWQITKQ